MTGASLLSTTLPTIAAIGVTGAVAQRAFKRDGKLVGQTHYHYRKGRAVSHRHEGGKIEHSHRGLQGYGKTRKTLRR